MSFTENLRQNPSDNEIMLSKRLRELSSGSKVIPKDYVIMQNLYFDISDNGMDERSRAELKRLIFAYGTKRDRDVSAQIHVEEPVVKKMYKNVYAAVDILTKTRNEFSATRLKMHDVIRVMSMVCDAMGQPIDGVASKSRKVQYVKCRVAVAYLTYSKSNVTTIARAMNRDHSSIIHYIRRAEFVLASDRKLSQICQQIKINTGL